MLIGYWINISVLLLLAGSTWKVLDGSAPLYGWQHYYYLVVPWLLLYGAFKGWYRCYTWRRMMMVKNISPDLSRGNRVPSKPKARSSLLEKLCLLLLLLSIAAIFKQLAMDGGKALVTFLSGLYSAIRFAFNLMT